MPDPTDVFQRFLTLLDTHGSWTRCPDADPQSMSPIFVQDDVKVYTAFDVHAPVPSLTRMTLADIHGAPEIDLLDHPLPCSHLDLYRPQRLLERIQSGAGARGRFAWERLEQILTGCILTTHPTAIGTWDVGLHPAVQSASGAICEAPHTIQFAAIYDTLRIESLPFDLPRLLREFQQTVGPVRLMGPNRLHTPLSLSLQIPTDFEERLQALEAVHETAHCPDLFVLES